MTMPHLMNCPHSSDSWCLTCVRDEWLYTMEIKMTLRAVIEKKNVRDIKLMESLVKYAEGLLAMNATEYAKLQQEYSDSMEKIAEGVRND